MSRPDIYIGEETTRAVNEVQITTELDADAPEIRLNPGSASVSLGTAESTGQLSLAGKDATTVGTVLDGDGHLDLGVLTDTESVTTQGPGGIPVRTYYPEFSSRIAFDGYEGRAVVGGNGADGAVSLKRSGGATTAEVRGDQGQVVVGGDGTGGSVMVKNDEGIPVGFVESDGDGLAIRTYDGDEKRVAIRINADGTVELPQGRA